MKVNGSQEVREISLSQLMQMRQTRSTQSTPLNFPKEKGEKFTNLIKQSPLDDRIPNKKSLARMGYSEVKGIKAPGEWYSDKNGNMINILRDDDFNINGCTIVSYHGKDGLDHSVTFDPYGNPLKGSISRTEKYTDGPIQGATSDCYDYEYDINGNPMITNHYNLGY